MTGSSPSAVPVFQITVRVSAVSMDDKKNQPASEHERAPEDESGEPGAEGGSQSDAADSLPAAPSKDDSALGDTDQHSSA